MLELEEVTLFNLDAVNPGRSLQAMLYTLKFVRFGEVVLATDPCFASNLQLDRYGIRLLPVHQSHEKIQGPSRMYFKDYELQALTAPGMSLSTDFVLFQEWDAAVLNPAAWDNAWLRVDYLGALWPHFYEPGWPPMCSGFRVGNGGFSLRSKRLCQLITQAVNLWNDDPALMSSDQWMCRTMRPWLETNGIVFGTEEQAVRFSCEDAIYTGQFGFHGKATAKMNGWSLPWF